MPTGLGIEQIQSLRSAVTPVAFEVYDVAESASILERLALVVDNTVIQEDPVVLEWVGAFFQMLPWLDDKSTQKVVKGDFSVPIEAYHITVKSNTKALQRPNAIAKQIPIAAEMAKAFSRGKVGLVAGVLRSNPLSYDGQNFFDTDHTDDDPESAATYSNIYAPAWVDKDAPTVAEMQAALREAMARFMTNRAIQNEIVDTGAATSDLVVIAGSAASWSILNQILTVPVINQITNDLFGTFALYRDMNPADSEDVTVIWSPPGGPRPVIFVVDEEPGEVKIDTSNEFNSRDTYWGLEGFYGAKAGWWQTAVRIEPTTAP